MNLTLALLNLALNDMLLNQLEEFGAINLPIPEIHYQETNDARSTLEVKRIVTSN